MTPRVFITHSSVDRELADAVVRALRLGTDTRADRVFCSSVDGFGIPTGSDFVQYIQEQLASTELVIPLITPAYLDSIFCMWELGAAWVREVTTCPIRVTDVSYADLPGLIANKHVATFDRAGLNSISLKVAEATDNRVVADLWEPERNALLDQLPGILGRLRRQWSETPLAKQRRAARAADAATFVHDAMHSLRDAAFVQIQHPDITGYESEFLSQLRSTTSATARCFSMTTGVHCRITIKELVLDDDTEDIYVKDLSRSEGRLRRTRDLVSENTDFESLFQGDERLFSSNNLAALRSAGQYKNSHVAPNQPLPYLSTIVWPIRKVVDHYSVATTIGALSDFQDVIGFLCVDAATADVFDQTDIQIGAAMADSLYSVLRPYLLPITPT